MARGGTSGTWPSPLAGITIPALIEENPELRAAGIAALNEDYRGWRTYETADLCIRSVRRGPWKFPMTLDADNPGQMRRVLDREEAA